MKANDSSNSQLPFDQKGERDIDLGNMFRLRFEPGILPYLERKFKCWENDFELPDLVVHHRSLSRGGTLLAANLSYSPGSYQIIRGRATYQVSSDGIYCDGPIDESFFEYEVLMPTINRLMAKNDQYIAYASGVVMDGRAIIFPAISGVGKTSLLLELMSRGAKYLGNSGILVKGDGTCTMYSPFINFKERNVAMFPELQADLFEANSEGRALKKRLSFHRMALSIKGENLASKYVRDNLISRFYFTENVDVNKLFPNREMAISAKASHFFYLERKEDEPVVIESNPKELANIVGISEWINPGHGGCCHNTLAEMAGLDFCAMNDYRRVFENLFSHGKCHRARIPRTSSRAVIKKIADEIERSLD